MQQKPMEASNQREPAARQLKRLLLVNSTRGEAELAVRPAAHLFERRAQAAQVEAAQAAAALEHARQQLRLAADLARLVALLAIGGEIKAGGAAGGWLGHCCCRMRA